MKPAPGWSSLPAGLGARPPGNLTEKEPARLAQLDAEALCPAKACQLRLMFQGIYRKPTPGRAHAGFGARCRLVRALARKYSQRLLAPMVKAAEMVEPHLRGILVHRSSAGHSLAIEARIAAGAPAPAVRFGRLPGGR